MRKRLSCWLGRHTWTDRVEQGERYEVCSACGTSPRAAKGDVRRPPHTYFGWRGGDTLVEDNQRDNP
jgi:hypothetical protein